ncbi:MAG: hypothetical protein ABR878_13300 [Roseiarcus sp.]|jgi:hypothetical protein
MATTLSFDGGFAGLPPIRAGARVCFTRGGKIARAEPSRLGRGALKKAGRAGEALPTPIGAQDFDAKRP